MTSKTFDPSRRRLFRQGAAIAGGAVLGGLVLKAKAAQDQRATQAVAMYQGTPHGQDNCARCVHFVPGKTAAANGACTLVQGDISPNGWCVFFAPKG